MAYGVTGIGFAPPFILPPTYSSSSRFFPFLVCPTIAALPDKKKKSKKGKEGGVALPVCACACKDARRRRSQSFQCEEWPFVPMAAQAKS